MANGKSGTATGMCLPSYRGGRRQSNFHHRSLELIDDVAVLMRAVVGLNWLDLHEELAGLFLILRVAGRVEGVFLGMWDKLKRPKT